MNTWAGSQIRRITLGRPGPHQHQGFTGVTVLCCTAGESRTSVLGPSQREPGIFPGCDALNAENTRDSSGAAAWTLSGDNYLFL